MVPVKGRRRVDEGRGGDPGEGDRRRRVTSGRTEGPLEWGLDRKETVRSVRRPGRNNRIETETVFIVWDLRSTDFQVVKGVRERDRRDL